MEKQVFSILFLFGVQVIFFYLNLACLGSPSILLKRLMSWVCSCSRLELIMLGRLVHVLLERSKLIHLPEKKLKPRA